jgi:cytochrome c oxidase assembly protein subunit 16
MVAGSFFLTPATALRYERHDRKMKRLTEEEKMGIGKDRRQVDVNEEYYRLAAKVSGNGQRIIKSG